MLNAIDRLLPEPVLRLDAPSTTVATVNRQGSQNRLVVHLLHYIPERRRQDFDVIEDVIPIFDVGISLKAERGAVGVTLVSDGKDLSFDLEKGCILFRVPEVNGHQMVSIQLEKGE